MNHAKLYGNSKNTIDKEKICITQMMCFTENSQKHQTMGIKIVVLLTYQHKSALINATKGQIAKHSFLSIMVIQTVISAFISLIMITSLTK